MTQECPRCCSISINSATTKALGLDVPQLLIARTDEVIE
jgi:hypothetical protein